MKKKSAILAWVMIALMAIQLLAGCTKNTDDNQTAPDTNQEESVAENQEGTKEAVQKFAPGTYEGHGVGKDGDIVLNVTFDESSITAIDVVEANETEGIGAKAIDALAKDIVSYQSLAVDAVSGASETTNGMLAAVEDAVVQAGGDVDALYDVKIVKENADQAIEKEADVVVIGAGASGVSAAISAADAGAKVIIIEKTATIGGASNLSWAAKFYNSSPSLANQLEIDTEREIKDWIINNHWRVNAAAVRQYVTQSGETYDWLANKGYNTQFINFAGEPLHMLPAYDTREATLREMLEASVVAGGGEVLTETKGESLMTNEAGAVTGVIASKTDGTTVTINAKAVIMATGGYAANHEMVKELFGFEGVNGGLGQNVGEGLEMAWAAGAKVPDNIGGQMLHQTLARATQDLKSVYSDFEASYPLMLSYLPTVMNVGPSGARFRDEAATLEAVAAANTSAFNGPFHYVIVSKSQVDALVEQGMNGLEVPSLPGMPPEFYATFADQFTLETPWENAYDVLDQMVADGNGYKGDTIEDLAKNAGMDVETFVDTYEKYSKATETGVDTTFGKDEQYLVSMGEEGPYYAIIAEVNNLGSVGGLLVDVDFKVLDDNRVPVKGLYAVGLESEGVLYNDTYVGNGVGLGYAFTSGRIGGKNAAEDVVEE